MRARCVKEDYLLREFILMTVVFFAGCTATSDRDAAAEEMHFNVVDSLLGQTVDIPQTGLSFRPPKGFQPIGDSMFKALKERNWAAQGDSARIDILRFYFDSRVSAGIAASEIRRLSLASDTSIFISRYRQALIETYGQGSVETADFWYDSIYVKQFLITDSVNVRFQLLCLTSHENALELNYFAPRTAYKNVVACIESSIGSLKLLTAKEKK